METVKLQATLRKGTGKGVARKLRREGLLPAVIYGGGRPEATPIAIKASDIKKIKHHSGLIYIDLEGEERVCILKDIQYNYLGDVPLHVDFHEVTFGEVITTTVEIEFVGTPVGVKEENGVLEIFLREVEIETLPKSIPEKLVVDISNLHAGDALHVSDIPVPEGVRILEDPETAVVVVSEQEEAPAEEESEEEASE
ncbi:50S ribosomal protein L25 [Desulfurobacterium atlanticum]|uniref:Large ribosomal subunit protein bL25 n=1 Tax=Desulfurobacterium atlanticum TaxID=240169 RepID=A0A238ZGF8_9BACT|nr:50S ribosomal protein L25 [Desulfurobacterium atlanticum]SNR82417.1 large subunit ribosomal protein L25 [Desulfurobacterium atlanticum]